MGILRCTFLSLKRAKLNNANKKCLWCSKVHIKWCSLKYTKKSLGHRLLLPFLVQKLNISINLYFHENIPTIQNETADISKKYNIEPKEGKIEKSEHNVPFLLKTGRPLQNTKMCCSFVSILQKK